MKDIRWGWVLLGALLANVAVTAIITPIAIVDGQERLGYVAPPASFVGVLLVGWWIARKAPQRAVLHGLLVGFIAMLVYLPIELSQEVTFAHYLSSALKVLGGAVGGLIAARRAAAKTATTPTTKL
jgi:putative membrane protein (TIGR04086 family)